MSILDIFYIMASLPEVKNRKWISGILIDAQMLTLSDAGKKSEIPKPGGRGEAFLVAESWNFKSWK